MDDTAEKIKPQFDFGILKKDQLIDEADALKNSSNENIGIFKIKDINRWVNEAKNLPTPRMLFSEFWHENEVCILFADTNQGKTILAVQLANSISRGHPIKGWRLGTQKQKVLYFDFELSAKQFEVRYSEKDVEGKLHNHFVFDENFIRVEINPDAEIPTGTSFEESINNSIEQSIIYTGATTLIIDNITYLRSATETAKDALPLMKHLKTLKNKYNLSILILAHTLEKTVKLTT